MAQDVNNQALQVLLIAVSCIDLFTQVLQNNPIFIILIFDFVIVAFVVKFMTQVVHLVLI